MKPLRWFATCMMVALILAGCGGSDGGGDHGTATLSLFLTDAPAPSYQAVYVTIDRVQVHASSPEAENAEGDGGWSTVASPQKTYNLLELVNGVMEELGTRELGSGHYTQIRLHLGTQPDAETNLLGVAHPYPNYLITESGDVQELKVPSGYQTGIKLTHGFDMEAGLTAELVLDFDASKSVVQAGNSGKYLLKPTIRIIDTLDNAVISGTVTDAQENALPDASVSVQALDPQALTEEDQVQVVTTTRTDENGQYLLYAPPGQYTLAATLNSAGEGLFYGPACAQVAAEYNTSHTIDFQLDATETAEVQVNLLSAGESVEISFRSADFCTEQIEIAAGTLSESGTFTVTLPDGDFTYQIVAVSGDAMITREVPAGTSMDIDFSASTP